MKKIIKTMSILALIIFTNCKDDINQNIILQKAVIEAYLSPNNIVDVLITKELPFSDTTTMVEVLDNLSVKIEYDGKTVALKSSGKGHYLSDFKIDSLKTYRLFFDYNGKIVEATTTIPNKPIGFKTNTTDVKLPDFRNATSQPVFPEVKLTWVNPQSKYHLLVVKNIEASPVSAGLFPTGSDKPSEKDFRNKPTQDNNYEVRLPTLEYLGNHNMILYRINPDYAALYNNNGTNSLNLTTPSTNVINGLGIFTGVAADTLKLYIRK
jgi:hypothetical protein